MNFKKTMILFLASALFLLSFTACSQGQSQDVTTTSTVEPKADNLYPELITGETDTTVTYLSTEGELTVTKKPEKVVVLLNSILDLWYLAGGEAIARVDGTTNVPPEAMEVPSLGKSSAVSIEELVALEPDLVVLTATFSSQVEMAPILKEHEIEYVLISGNVNPYESFKQNLYLFSKILDTKDVYDRKIEHITNEVQGVIDQAAQIEEKPSVIILYSSAKNVMCELPNSLTGDIAESLGLINIAGDTAIEGANKVDFSMEILIERDPDYVLITTMGDENECKARVEQDIVANEAWNSLTAVKEGRVYYLPKELFMYKPNARYPEAFKELAKIVYPEVFGGGQ